MDSLKDLLVEELKDAYDFEHRLVKALEEMSTAVTADDLRSAFESHKEQTQRQVDRLEKAFTALGEKPEREECKGIEGLVGEFKEFVKEEKPSDDVLNVFAAGAAIKTEHYEIHHYESLIRIADQLRLTDVKAPLQEILVEEKATAKELDSMLDKLISQVSS